MTDEQMINTLELLGWSIYMDTYSLMNSAVSTHDVIHCKQGMIWKSFSRGWIYDDMWTFEGSEIGKRRVPASWSSLLVGELQVVYELAMKVEEGVYGNRP